MSGDAVTVPDWMTRPGAPCTMSIEPPVTMRAAAFDWGHEIQVALPPSYGVSPEARYPVLWLTDGPLVFHLAVGLLNVLVASGQAPEMILVGVGCASDAGLAEMNRRRDIEFGPPGGSFLPDGPGGDLMRAMGLADDGPRQADAFLAFLVDEVRPPLARAYRMDAADHGLMGHSHGGLFASYALFARPGAFRRYLIGSPSINAAGRAVFRLEADYAAANADLAADIFFAAGEGEMGQLGGAAWGLVSAAVLMAETLLLRRYPSLKVTTRIFPGKDHLSVVPDLIGEGLRTLWADRLDPA
jgi:predicted alpha/beta superfamily hydrolase